MDSFDCSFLNCRRRRISTLNLFPCVSHLYNRASACLSARKEFGVSHEIARVPFVRLYDQIIERE